MKEERDIEQLFRSSFEDFEVTPPPAVKEAIDRRIAAPWWSRKRWLLLLLLLIGLIGFGTTFAFFQWGTNRETHKLPAVTAATSGESTYSDKQAAAESSNPSHSNASGTTTTSGDATQDTPIHPSSGNGSGERRQLNGGSGNGAGKQRFTHSSTGKQNASAPGGRSGKTAGSAATTSTTGKRASGGQAGETAAGKQSSGKRGGKTRGGNASTGGKNGSSAGSASAASPGKSNGGSSNGTTNTGSSTLTAGSAANGANGASNGTQQNGGNTAGGTTANGGQTGGTAPSTPPVDSTITKPTAPQTPADSTQTPAEPVATTPPPAKPASNERNWMVSIYGGPHFGINKITPGDTATTTFKERASFLLSAEIQRHLKWGFEVNTGFNYGKRTDAFSTSSTYPVTIYTLDSIPIFNQDSILVGWEVFPDTIMGTETQTNRLSQQVTSFGIPIYVSKHFHFGETWGMLVNAGAIINFQQVRFSGDGDLPSNYTKTGVNAVLRLHATYDWNRFMFSAGVNGGIDFKPLTVDAFDRKRYYLTPQVGIHFKL